MKRGAPGARRARYERATHADGVPLRPPRARLPTDGSPPVLFVRKPRAKSLRAARGSALIGAMCAAPIVVAVWLVWVEFARVQSGLPTQAGPITEWATATPILAAPPQELLAGGPLDSGAVVGAALVASARDVQPPPDVSPPARADGNGPRPPDPSPAVRQTAPAPERARAERRAPPQQAAPEPPPAPGRLFISSRPWGRLFVDGTLVGNTPKADLPLNPGDHSVRIERDGYCPFEQPIHVTAGHHVRLVGIVLQECSP